MTIDPTNPNIVYLGGTADGNPFTMIRIDATDVNDQHAFFLNNDLPGGAVRRNYVTGGVTIESSNPEDRRDNFPFGFDARTSPVMNLYRNPNSPQGASATVGVNNAGAFANNGAGVRWTGYDSFITGTDVHRAFSLVDPLTGKGRLVIGYDQGIATAVDDGSGGFVTQDGTMTVPFGSRNGNIQITQFYYGAAQPSRLAAQIAGALFYGQAQDDGFPRSSPDVLDSGNINWPGSFGDGTGVATDQLGSGTLYQYNWPCCGGGGTDFFQVNGVGRTNGLIRASGTGQVPDPQWPFLGGSNFAVNPINNKEIVISSVISGRVFRTLDQGQNWDIIGEPSLLGSAYFPALAFGAPADPTTGNTGDYILGGNTAGQVYVTYNGGASWTQINNGALAGNGAGVQAIVPNPTPGNFEAYAVTSNGVFHIADTRPSSGATWTNITGNLFQVTHQIFGKADLTDLLLANIKAMAVDWRYVIPNDLSNPPTDNPTDPARTHPVLYVAGEGGVLVSYDDGASWQRFPSAIPAGLNATPDTPGDGGGFPTADVRDLDLSLGNIQRTTGRPDLAGPYDPISPECRRPRPAPGHDLRPRLVRHPADAGDPPQHGAARSQERRGHRVRRHPGGEHRPTRVRRPELHHRLQERHPDHHRRRDRSRQSQDHRRLRSRSNEYERGGQLDRRLRSVLDPGQARDVHDRGPEDGRALRHRRRRVRR